MISPVIRRGTEPNVMTKPPNGSYPKHSLNHSLPVPAAENLILELR